jgi:hypothetical protein
VRFERAVAEALAAAALGAAIMVSLYASWWLNCCRAATNAILSVLFLPGVFLGWVIGGGPHGAQRLHYYIGAAVEFFVLWLVLRLVLLPRFTGSSSSGT